MSNREKPNLAHIVIEAAIPVIVGMLFTVAVQWITMESAIVNVSASAELDGQYLTVERSKLKRRNASRFIPIHRFGNRHSGYEVKRRIQFTSTLY